MHGYWAQFVAIALAHLLGVASPGPDFAMVVRQSLMHGRRAAIWTSLGIGSAILMHVTYALLGLGIVLRASPLWFDVVKYAGAAYLAWIGAKGLMSKPKTTLSEAPAGAQGALTVPTEPTPRAAWTTGFLTNIFNPKATLFFVAVFVSLVSPSTPKLIQAAYGAWMATVTAAWFTMVSLVFTREDVRGAFLRAGHWIDRVMGVVFLGLAVWLSLASLR